MHEGSCFARLALALPFSCACLCFSDGAHAQNPATDVEDPSIHVIATTPVPGVGTPVEEIPAAVRSLSAKDIDNEAQPDLSSLLERALPGVSLSLGQGNAFQPELVYRGFSASPLPGAPQGMSVFVDGIRVNEAFGDTVNWDLIPASAISTVHLLPGSNPVYGLNTLGGALTINTKSGFSYPGQVARLTAGSFGRRGLQMESGGHGEHGDYFVAMNSMDETGWRRHSSSAIRQFFGKTGWQDNRTDIDLSMVLADNTLAGTQSLPLSMLGDPRQAYTWPDRTGNQAYTLGLRASHYIGLEWLLSGNLYSRRYDSVNVSSNVNDNFNPAVLAGPGNSQGFNTRSRTAQDTDGFSIQLAQESSWWNRPNRFTFGGAVDQGRVSYVQDQQEAVFIEDRNTLGTSGFTPVTSARMSNTYYGLFFSNNHAATERWNLVVSGRYNIARVRIRDASGTASQLDGDHTFRRFNPAVGLTFNPAQGNTWFGNYNEGMRAPTPMELTCADPSAPCRLPNAFLADPPLNPVIARTWEAGMRTKRANGAFATATVYRTVLDDDIQFISSGGTANAGFFQNVGRSRRQGLELIAGGALRDVRLSAGYTWTDARYLSDFTMHSPNNSQASGTGDIQVSRGNRIPGIPAYTLKLRLDWSVTVDSTLGMAINETGAQYVRGDENNADSHGRLPSYRVVDANAAHRLTKDWELLMKIDNVFNRRYETFGILGQNYFRGAGDAFDATQAGPEQFRTPGGTRAFWLFIRYALDARVARSPR